MRIEVQATPVLSYAMAHNRVPVVSGITVDGDEPIVEDALLTVEIRDSEGALSRPWQRMLSLTSAGRLDVRAIDLVCDPARMSQIAEQRPASVVAVVTAGETELGRGAADVQVLAAHQWLAVPRELGLEMLAAYVMPNAPEIAALVSEASRLLGEMTGDDAIEGYQSGPDRADQIARAIYEVMQRRGIHYSEPPPSWGDVGQKIRTPAEVLRPGGGGAATCLDSAVCYAAALEHAGLRPLVWPTVDHAICAYRRDETPSPAAVLTEVNDLINRTDLGEFGLVETTGVTRVLPWAEAGQHAYRQLLRPAADVLGAVDVVTARQSGVLPLPAVARDENGAVVLVEYRAAEHILTESGDRPERQPGRQRDPLPPRFVQWQKALLDLTLRNRLLNLTPSTGLRLAVGTRVAELAEDDLARGRALPVLPWDSVDQVHLARGEVTSLDGLPAEAVDTTYRRGRVLLADVSGQVYAGALQNLAYKARTVEEETGANALFLAIGELVWEQDSRPLRAPLLLVPVHLRSTARGRYELRADETSQTSPNWCLVEKVRLEHNVRLTSLEQPLEDSAGLDIAATFDAVREQLVAAGLPYRIERAARLAVLQFTKYRPWRDIDDHWQTMLESPVVSHLALHATEPWRQEEAPATDLDALGMRCPIGADASQVEAIATALAGRSFVLEGPPGTGKSQTITNLLATAVAAGKRVLFVAEKRAALEVVKRRLTDIGLDSLSLDLHDRSAKPTEIRRQILEALDLEVSSRGKELALAQEDQQAKRRPLARYVGAVHEQNGAGLSLYEAVADPAPDVPPIKIGPELVGPGRAEFLTAVQAVMPSFADLADAVVLDRPTPWGFVTTPVRVEPKTVRAAAQAVEEAMAGLQSPGVLACRNGHDLRALAGLLGAGFDVETLDLAISDGWGQRVQGVLSEAMRFAEQPREWSQVVSPGILTHDIDRLVAGADAAARSFWLFRGIRLRQVREQFASAILPGTRVGTGEIVPLLAAVRATRDESLTFGGTLLTRLPGVRLPGWHPLAPDAEERLVTEAERVRAWAAVADPRGPSARVATAFRETLREGAHLAGPVARLAEAWDALAEATAADDEATTAWAGEQGLVARWRETSPRRDLADPGLRSWQAWLALLDGVDALRPDAEGVRRALLAGRIDPDTFPLTWQRGLTEASVPERLAAGGLRPFDNESHERRVERYRAAADHVRILLRDDLLDSVLRRRTFLSSSTVGQVGELRRELAKKRRGLSVRDLIGTYGSLIAEIMPCTLVSPDSLSRFYPVRPDLFDLVVFDEASQIRVADAVGALARASSAVVVGDSRQMPPTSVMEVTLSDDAVEEGAVADEESILSECVQAGWPRRWLSWHYRSADESLIAFSNAAYYAGRLSTFPAPVVGAADPGVGGHGVSLIRVDGTFLRSGKGAALRTNPEEADAVVAAIRERFDAAPPGSVPSIGVVTFNIQQRTLIERLLRETGDERIVAALESSHEGLFVKNLETVQGDERDVVMFSTAFSVNQRGVLPLNFGPLNLAGGERRLNVAVTRARRQVLVFSSFDPDQLRAEQTSAAGVRDLKAYLEMAAGRPVSVHESRRRADAHREDIATKLRAAGVVVDTDVGMSDFRIDLRLATADEPERPLVAVLLDSPEWARRRLTSDQFDLPHSVLERLRWPAVEWVWLPEWLEEPETVVERLLGVLRDATIRATQMAARPFTPDAVYLDDESEPDEPEEGDDESDQAEPEGLVADSGAEADGWPVHGLVGDAAMVAPAPVTSPASPAQRGGLSGLPGEEEFVPWAAPHYAPEAMDSFRTDSSARYQVIQAMLDCVVAEGPVHPERIVSLVCAAHGRSRVMARTRTELLKWAGMSPEAFQWPQRIDPETWRGFRRSYDLGARPLKHISDEEILNAMTALVRGSRGMSVDEALRSTYEVFGGVRLTAQARGRLASVQAKGVREGRLRVDGDAVDVV